MKSLYCAANKLRGTFDQCSTAVKNTISCLLHANCGANTQRPVWSAYVLRITMPTELRYALHTQKCKCSSAPGYPLCQDLWCPAEKQFVSFFIRCASSSVRFKCPTVSVFASHQYCFCAVNKWMRNVYNPNIQKVRSAVKVFCSSQCWSCA